MEIVLKVGKYDEDLIGASVLVSLNNFSEPFGKGLDRSVYLN